MDSDICVPSRQIFVLIDFFFFFNEYIGNELTCFMEGGFFFRIVCIGELSVQLRGGGSKIELF